MLETIPSQRTQKGKKNAIKIILNNKLHRIHIRSLKDAYLGGEPSTFLAPKEYFPITHFSDEKMRNVSNSERHRRIIQHITAFSSFFQPRK